MENKNVSEAKVTEADREAAEELAMKVCEMTDWKDTVQYVASALAQRHADGIREGVEKHREELEMLRRERITIEKMDEDIKSTIQGLEEELARLRELTRPVESDEQAILECLGNVSPALKADAVALCQRVRADAERKALEVLPFSKEEGLIVQKVFEAVKDSAVADGLLVPGYNKKLDELPTSVKKQSQVAVWAVLEFLRTRSTGKGES